MRSVFGPVSSRRLGRSLGIDLVPFKTCSFDCIYCQLGRTTDNTMERREWVSFMDVLAELKERIACRPDYITFSGSGEPTLYSRLGELIEAIRAMTRIPIAVLTNGSLLWQPEVRAELRNASLVIPSLDAGDAAMLEAVNRPHPDFDFEQLVEGLIALRQEFKGQYWLEVLLLAGRTANEEEVRKIADIVERINPDRVQLNTATRPPAEVYAHAAGPNRLRALAKLFHCPVDLVEDHRSKGGRAVPIIDDTGIFELIHRRPCTVDDIVDALDLHRVEVLKRLSDLQNRDLVKRRRAGRRVFFCVTANEDERSKPALTFPWR